MDEKKIKPIDKIELRHQAEELSKEINEKEKSHLIEEADTQRLLHELQVHQIELEMQNEQLLEAQSVIEKTLEKYEDLYNFAPVGYFSLDKNSVLLQLNLTGAKILGLNRSQLKNRRLVEFILEEKRLEFFEIIKKIFNNQIIESFESILKLNEDKLLDVHIEAKASEDLKECRLAMVDISKRKQLEKKLGYLSMHDQLTGLYNRRFLDEEISRLDTARNLPLTISIADVNGLKIVNDVFGHEAGDRLLQKVSGVLKNEYRADDIIARTGGDEFLILLPKTDKEAAEQICKRVKTAVEAEKINNINISVSFGWETKETEDTDILAIRNKAEDFMYSKKIFENLSKRSVLIKSILNTLHIKSPGGEKHSKRVGKICEDIGKIYNLSDDNIKMIKNAGELHDIGEIVIDKATLNKKGKLTETEWSEIKRHSEAGFRLLGTSNEFYKISEYILAHHEHWDGKGYPKGLKGKAILWESRVIALADAYDAMTCECTYKKALSEKEAVKEIKRCAGTQFDPEIARVFVEKCLKQKW